MADLNRGIDHAAEDRGPATLGRQQIVDRQPTAIAAIPEIKSKKPKVAAATKLRSIPSIRSISPTPGLPTMGILAGTFGSRP